MQKNKEFLSKIKKIIPCERLFIDEPLANHTTFRIGGPADYFVLPSSIAEIAELLKLAQEYNISVTVLGNGSNVLVLDSGIRGLVLKFAKEMSYIRHEGHHVFAGAGALLCDVSRYAAELGLAGMEFAVGIPGSIGGSVFMNAGAYEGEMSNIVVSVTAVCKDGSIQRFNKEELQFSYRHSIFHENHCTICEVELAFQNGEHTLIRSKMGDFTTKRETKQPLEVPSAGSTFKRPPGHFAGTLIEQTGLKGLTIGGAQVSPKHAGFIINAGGATAQDVLNLIKEVQRRVHEKHGVMLYPEVRTLGEP
ncbi:UDP-N-acetylenolpyruvoylglucosamine reductase [Sporomusaceae bacterium FL31]|nr:UDP-N-acetylenolpyruvoylglucosamine reductase [Sporomusaceae bacterium FL31]GCE32257.1 UDP-N-acetylenolpyruvoylglucosamine reductase [Sporomusaceae bacterium]